MRVEIVQNIVLEYRYAINIYLHSVNSKPANQFSFIPEVKTLRKMLKYVHIHIHVYVFNVIFWTVLLLV